VPESDQIGRVTRFGVFEVDVQAGELRKSGLRVKLQDQPFQILALLLEHAGQVVTREELRQRLWPADTFVEYDHNLNSSVKKLRQALGDDPDNPRFVETLPRRGYRLIVPVTGTVTSSDRVVEESSVSKVRNKRRPGYYRLAVLGAVIVTVAALVLRQTFRAPALPRIVRFTALTNDGQVKPGPMATDGSRIYFNEALSGPRNVIVQVSTKGGEAVPLPLPLKQPSMLDLSEDGTELLIGNDEGNGQSSLWVLPVAGGSPRRVGTVLARGARFTSDGTSVIYGNGHDVYTVNRDGSSPRRLLTTDNWDFSFRFSPDAKAFRFTKYDRQIGSLMIMEAAANGTGLHRMFPGSRGKWTSDGQFFIFEKQLDGRTDLWGLPEARSVPWRKRDVKPTQLTAGPLSFGHPLPSKDGKEIFAIGGSHRAEVIRYDSRSDQFVPYLSGISAEGLAFSRDGQWVTYTSYPEGTLWRSKVDGSERRQLTFQPLRVLLPRWSPDSKQIAFFAALPGEDWNIYVVASEGGAPQRLIPSDRSQADPNWSPDGRSLIFSSFSVAHEPIYSIDIQSKRVSAVPGSTGLFSPRWSPNGRYIAALTTEHPFKLMLFDFSTQKWREAFGSEVGYLWWSREGKYIYFQDKSKSAQGAHNRVVRLRLSDGKIENVVDIKNVGRLTAGTIVDWFGLAPDDSPLFARDISTSEIWALDVEWP
jgi:Tol biopolymer transport system component/DNA-binding winged helix-turn-helix (wHTH) protein